MKMEKAVMAVLMMLVLSITLTACDKGKKPYEEAETLFNKSDYAAAKSKAAEVMQNAPSSKYIAQAKAIYEKVEKIELLFKNAGEAVQGADYGKAIKEYEGVLALDPKSPKAMEELKAVRVKYKEGQFQAAGVLIENGEYEKGIDAYKELLALIPNDAESTEVLRKTEKTLADLKGVGNEAISEFRTYIKARGTMDYERAEFARVRYVDNAKEMYRLPGGRKYLEARLKGYMAEVEEAMKGFDAARKGAERAMRSGNYNAKVIAADNYNKALSQFIKNYGRPEAWMEGQGRSMLKNKVVSQWMPR